MDRGENAKSVRKTMKYASVWASHQPCLGRYQGEIGHCGRHEQLEQRLFLAKIACLANSQLHQTSKAMLGHLSKPTIRCIVLTLLEPPGPLYQGFLRVQRYGAPFARPRLYARRTQRTRCAHGGVKLEYPSLVAPASPVLELSPWHQGGTFLPRWAAARLGLQIDREVFLSKVCSVPPTWDLSDELSPGLCKSLARRTVVVRTVANRLLNLYPRVLFRLLHQLQRLIAVVRIA